MRELLLAITFALFLVLTRQADPLIQKPIFNLGSEIDDQTTESSFEWARSSESEQVPPAICICYEPNLINEGLILLQAYEEAIDLIRLCVRVPYFDYQDSDDTIQLAFDSEMEQALDERFERLQSSYLQDVYAMAW